MVNSAALTSDNMHKELTKVVRNIRFLNSRELLSSLFINFMLCFINIIFIMAILRSSYNLDPALKRKKGIRFRIYLII